MVEKIIENQTPSYKLGFDLAQSGKSASMIAGFPIWINWEEFNQGYKEGSPQNQHPNKFHHLRALLATMELPISRKMPYTDTDLSWLGRNLIVANRHHPNFAKACDLLEELQVRLIVRGDK